MRRLPRLRTPVLPPEGYHGGLGSRQHFEGWYVKAVSADRSARLASIPGVFVSESEGGPREAFVQVLDGATGRSWYTAYPLSAFEASSTDFDVRIGPNHFTSEGFALDMPDPRLTGSVRYTTAVDPWPVTASSPGAMGWYAFVPLMECYHGVLSFGHDLAGQLELEGQEFDFGGGRGYIEKDWGRSFPAGYVWMHSNHFTDPSISLMASVALVPWMRGQFRGVVVGLRHGDDLHRFATYTGARTKAIGIDGHSVRWAVANRDGMRLELTASRVSGSDLAVPSRHDMHRRVEETLDATIRVRLSNAEGTVLVEDVGEVGGLEVHGDVARLLTTADRGAGLRR